MKQQQTDSSIVYTRQDTHVLISCLSGIKKASFRGKDG